MRRIAFFLLAVLLAGACKSEPAFLDGASIFDLESGKALSARKASRAAGIYGTMSLQLFDSQQFISFVKVNPAVYGTDILCGEGELADSTSALCTRHGAVAGINGSYFDMSALTPVTYVKDDGFEVGTPLGTDSLRVNGCLISAQDGFRIDALDSLSLADTWWEAISSGPILVDEGTVFDYPESTPGWEGFYNTRHPRSLVGKDADGYLWFVTVDGRAPGEAEGMSIAELTELSLLLGFTDALNLDGGGSTTLWTLTAGVLNHPTDNHRFDPEGQRPVPNVISLKKVLGR